MGIVSTSIVNAAGNGSVSMISRELTTIHVAQVPVAAPDACKLQHVVEQGLHAYDPSLHQPQVIADTLRKLGAVILADPGRNLADRPQRRTQVMRRRVREIVQFSVATFELRRIAPHLLFGRFAPADVANERAELAVFAQV